MKEKRRKLKIKRKENKGITLIALVITIIVLLILAGVSIAMLTGENGILNQAQNASTETEKASVIEQAKTDIIDRQIENQNGSITKADLKEILGKYFDLDSNTEIPDDLTGFELKTKEEYGGQTIEISDIYNGTFAEEKEYINTETSYVGYYADIDDDGTVDGIIYADLAVGGSGNWNDDDYWSHYSYEAKKTGLKEYYVKEESYSSPDFNNIEGKVIAPIKGTTGEDRFYVMALKDFNPGTYYCWYDAAYGNLKKPVEASYNDFGAGKENTKTMIGIWNDSEWGAQNDNETHDDMWGAVQTAVGDIDDPTWFVPSKAEWAAFGDVATKTLGLTTSNHSKYGLKNFYWASSQGTADYAYYALFSYGNIYYIDVNSGSSVRLSATF